MRYKILCLLCLIFLACSDFLKSPFSDSSDSSDSPTLERATLHGSGLNVFLAIHCQSDMACRSSLSINGTPESQKHKWGFHYTFIGGGDTLIAEEKQFINGTDTTHSWNLPVIGKHIQFSLLDKKRKSKDYDIDLTPWLGKISQSQDSVTFTNFESGSNVCHYKIQERSSCRTIQDKFEEITISNDSSYYSFFKVQQKEFPITIGKYTDYLYIMTTVYWR